MAKIIDLTPRIGSEIQTDVETLHAMIPGSQIAEPPWGDREWIDRLQASARGEGLFARWPLLAPQILAFAGATVRPPDAS